MAKAVTLEEVLEMAATPRPRNLGEKDKGVGRVLVPFRYSGWRLCHSPFEGCKHKRQND